MGVIKVETFNVNIANGSTHTLTNDVGSLTSAFIRRPGPSDKASGGPTGSTGNQAPNSVHCGVEFTGTNQLTFRAGNTTTRKIMGEIWRYTGAPGGADEFICRGHLAVTMSGTTGTAVIPGLVDRNRVVPFITGVSTTASSVNDYDISTFAAHVNSSGQLVVSSNNGGATGTVYVDVVEFTGSNWTVAHAISSSHDASDETVTLNSDSTGSGGSTVSVEPSSSVIEINMQGDAGGETGLSDVLATAVFTSNTQVQFRQEGDGDGNAANDGDGYIHVFSNDGINVTRGNIVSISETNGGTEATIGFPGGSPTNRLLDELSLEWMVDTTGVGTAHARGRLNARITNASGTIEHWVHRSGNDVDVRYGVIDLTGVLGVATLALTDVDGDEVLSNTQTNVVITGVALGAVQGTGSVTFSDTTAGTGTNISQTIVSWSDSSVTINFDAGALADSNGIIRLTNNDGAVGTIAVQAGIPPITYQEAVLSLAPDHYWPLNGDYIDVASSLNWSVRSGSPSFTANPLTRGRSNAWTVSAQGQEAGPANSNQINAQSETTRSMGGWIRFTEVQASFVMFYEEGGSVNNIAFLMGVGGILIAQLADTGDDNVHAYSDFALQPNRNYHIMFRFDYNSTDRFELLVDGVVQISTFGNPLTSSGGHLDSHSGDIAFGDSSDSLEVFGTDINFPAATTAYYQDWATWTSFITDAETRSILFEQGVRGEIEITSGTQAAMQLQLDAFAGTIQPNSDCIFRIAPCTDGDFTLDFDNITFDEGTTLQIQYLGVDVLTANNLNGTNLDSNKVSGLNGGTVNIVTPSQITVSGLQPNTEVRIFVAGTTTEIAGIENTTGSFVTSVQTSAVDISVLNLAYQNLRVKNVDTSSDAFVPVVQRIDRQYSNP